MNVKKTKMRLKIQIVFCSFSTKNIYNSSLAVHSSKKIFFFFTILVSFIKSSKYFQIHILGNVSCGIRGDRIKDVKYFLY